MRFPLALLLGLACALAARAAAPTPPARAAEPVWEAPLARFDPGALYTPGPKGFVDYPSLDA
jgi:hypothetical protein